MNTKIHYHNCCGCPDGWCKTTNPDGSVTECVPDSTLLEPPTEAEQWRTLAFKALQFIDQFKVQDNFFSCTLESKQKGIGQAYNANKIIESLNEEYVRLAQRTIITEEKAE